MVEMVEMVEIPLTHPPAQSCCALVNAWEPHLQHSAPQPAPAPDLPNSFVLPQLQAGDEEGCCQAVTGPSIPWAPTSPAQTSLQRNQQPLGKHQDVGNPCRG